MRMRRVIIATLSGIVLLGILMGWGTSSQAPALDAATQRYVSLLRTYYVPLVNAHSPARTCLRDTGNARQADQAQTMAGCRALFAAELTTAQTFATQIATGTPPAALQLADTSLRRAAPQLVTLLSGQLAAIDNQKASDFIASEDPGTMALFRFVPAILAIDTVIYPSQAPQAPPLPLMGYVYPR